MPSFNAVTIRKLASSPCLFGLLLSSLFTSTTWVAGADLVVSITGGPDFTVEQSVPTDPDTISIPAGDKNPLLILATLTNVGSETFVGIPSSTLFTTAMGDSFFLSGSAGIVDGETVNEGDGLTDMAASPPFTGGFILEPGGTKEFVLHLIYGLLCNGCA